MNVGVFETACTISRGNTYARLLLAAARQEQAREETREEARQAARQAARQEAQEKIVGKIGDRIAKLLKHNILYL